MTTSAIKATIHEEIHKVWEAVTEVENYGNWRSDLSECKRIDEKQFVEYTKEGYATNFTITDTEMCKRWEFNMENTNMNGHWVGIFTSKGDETELDFTESVTVKKFIMKPFVKLFLKKQQTLFIADLKKALEKERK